MEGQAMDTDSRTADQGNDQGRDRDDILRRIEEKLDRLLAPSDDDRREHERGPLGSRPDYPGPGDLWPGFFGGPPADAPGWDAGIAPPRFDVIDVGAVGTHGVDPVSSFDGAQAPLFNARSSAREYYLLSRARQAHAGAVATGYAEYRRRKEAELDREYADYRRDQQARFDRDFDAWRRKRGKAPESTDAQVGKEETANQHGAEGG
jgi:hypothetical protein